jgi:hypothetical protein
MPESTVKSARFVKVFEFFPSFLTYPWRILRGEESLQIEKRHPP